MVKLRITVRCGRVDPSYHKLLPHILIGASLWFCKDPCTWLVDARVCTCTSNTIHRTLREEPCVSICPECLSIACNSCIDAWTLIHTHYHRFAPFFQRKDRPYQEGPNGPSGHLYKHVTQWSRERKTISRYTYFARACDNEEV